MGKYFETFEQIIDKESGEEITSRRVIKQTIAREKFMAIYLQDASGYLEIESTVHFKVLFALWQLAEFDTNELILIKSKKEEIAAKLEYAYKTVDNAITQLAKKQIIIRKNTSVYYLNPKFFWKGSEIARSKALEVVLQYNIEDFENEKIPSDSEVGE